MNMKNGFGKLKNFWSNPPKDRHLNLKEILAFGGSSLGVSFIVNVVSSMLTATQISEVYQIGVLHGPIICMVASIAGLILQPLYGKLLQNTKTKFGRYKPYILFLAPVVAVFALLSTWQPQNLSDQTRLIYAYMVCTPTMILYNIWFNTFNMMPAVITPNQQERTDVWAPIGLVMGFAPTLINVVKGFIRGYFLQQGAEYLAYRYMGLISVVFGIAMVLCILKVKERIITTSKNNEKVGVLEGLKMVFKNVPLMIFSLALILGCMRTTIEVDIEILGKLRYATTIDQGLQVFAGLTLIVGFAATPNMLFLPFLTRKFNNKTIIMLWTFLNIAGYLVLGTIGVENIPRGSTSAAVFTVFRFIALFNAVGSLQPLMLSEIYDYQQWKTGKRLEGFIQTFAYALVAVFTNIGIVIMGFVKQGMGYEPKDYFNVTDVSDVAMKTATDYFNVALIISAISAALMFITMFFYNLSKNKHGQIMGDLKKISIQEGYTETNEEVSNIIVNDTETQDTVSNSVDDDTEIKE